MSRRFSPDRRENIDRGRRETVAESSPARDVSSGQGAAAFFQIKKAPFSRSLFVGINRTFAPSPPKGRKHRGGSANVETVFARTPRENIARGRRETVAESSPARDVSSGQGAAAFFQTKKTPFFAGAFMLLLNRIFAPFPPKGRKHRGGGANVETVFARSRRDDAGIAELFQGGATKSRRKPAGRRRRRRGVSARLNTRRNRDPARGRYPRPAREACFPNWRSRGQCSAGGAPASARRRKAPRRSWPRPREDPMQ